MRMKMRKAVSALLLMMALGMGIASAQCPMNNTAFKSGEFLA